MYLLIANATDASRPAARKSSHRRDAAENVREQHVENGAEDERTENADGHVAFRISRFLSGGRDGIETNISEKHNAGSTENPENSTVIDE